MMWAIALLLGQSWTTVETYPSVALRNNWQGTVVMALTVSPEGRVSQCDISVSSGHKVLDDAACDVMVRRVQFKPATDEQGRPVVGHRSYTMTWKLPKD